VVEPSSACSAGDRARHGWPPPDQSPPGGPASGWAPPDWALWRLPVRAIAVVLVVQAAAVALIATGARTADPADLGPDLLMAGILVLCSVVHTELAIGIERVRRRAGEVPCFDLSSVWTFAAAVLLAPALSGAVVVLVYLHLWRRVWRPAGMPPHRHLYTTATVVLAAGAAHLVVGPAGLPVDGRPVAVLVVAAAVLAYLVVNTVLVAGVIALTGGGSTLRAVLGRWDDNAVELATVCMGALAAVALGSAPGLVVLVLPPILVLHRAVLVRQLEEAAATDAKTGLLTATAWQARAEQAVRRAGRNRGSAAVLILDLDHFKVVNDAHGHLAGDGVLAAVAEQLRAGVRQGDLVGRFGGEEFLVLLPDLPAGASGRTELDVVAERLRRRIAELEVPVRGQRRGDGGAAVETIISGLSVSIGGATVPIDGTELDQVLRAADASLYAAKREGRNLVRIAGRATVPVPRRPLL
jgi:diguanylate cyclase (GGDEF)-like protein